MTQGITPLLHKSFMPCFLILTIVHSKHTVSRVILDDLYGGFYVTATETIHHGLANKLATNELMRKDLTQTGHKNFYNTK